MAIRPVVVVVAVPGLRLALLLLTLVVVPMYHCGVVTPTEPLTPTGEEPTPTETVSLSKITDTFTEDATMTWSLSASPSGTRSLSEERSLSVSIPSPSSSQTYSPTEEISLTFSRSLSSSDTHSLSSEPSLSLSPTFSVSDTVTLVPTTSLTTSDTTTLSVSRDTESLSIHTGTMTGTLSKKTETVTLSATNSLTMTISNTLAPSISVSETDTLTELLTETSTFSLSSTHGSVSWSHTMSATVSPPPTPSVTHPTPSRTSSPSFGTETISQTGTLGTLSRSEEPSLTMSTSESESAETVTETGSDSISISQSTTESFGTLTSTLSMAVTDTTTLTATDLLTDSASLVLSSTETFTPTYTLSMSSTLALTPTETTTVSPPPTFTKTFSGLSGTPSRGTRTNSVTDTATMVKTRTATAVSTLSETLSLTSTLGSPSVTATFPTGSQTVPTESSTGSLSGTIETVTATNSYPTPSETFASFSTTRTAPTRSDSLSESDTFYTVTETDSASVPETMTMTITPAPTPTLTSTVSVATETISDSFSSTLSETLSPTETVGTVSATFSDPSFSATVTDTITPPPTPTVTFTVSISSSVSETVTQTITPPPTPTATHQFTETLTFSDTGDTSTFTDTLALTETPTVSDETLSFSSSATGTLTLTSSTSYTLSSTPATISVSTSLTSVTRIPTESETILSTTETVTVSPPDTPTATRTETITTAPTPTATESIELSKTVTPLHTETLTVSPTFSALSTPSATIPTPSFSHSYSRSGPVLEILFPYTPKAIDRTAFVNGGEGGGAVSASVQNAADLLMPSAYRYFPKMYANAFTLGNPLSERTLVLGLFGGEFALDRAHKQYPADAAKYFYRCMLLDTTGAPVLTRRRFRLWTSSTFAEVNRSQITLRFPTDPDFPEIHTAELGRLTFLPSCFKNDLVPSPHIIHFVVMPGGSHRQAPPPLVARSTETASSASSAIAVTVSSVFASHGVLTQYLSRGVVALNLGQCRGLGTRLQPYEHPTGVSLSVTEDEPTELSEFVGALVMNLALCVSYVVLHYAVGVFVFGLQTAKCLRPIREMIASRRNRQGRNGRRQSSPSSRVFDDSTSTYHEHLGEDPTKWDRVPWWKRPMVAGHFPSYSIVVLLLYPPCVKAATVIFFRSQGVGTLLVALVCFLPWLAWIVFIGYTVFTASAKTDYLDLAAIDERRRHLFRAYRQYKYQEELQQSPSFHSLSRANEGNIDYMQWAPQYQSMLDEQQSFSASQVSVEMKPTRGGAEAPSVLGGNGNMNASTARLTTLLAVALPPPGPKPNVMLRVFQPEGFWVDKKQNKFYYTDTIGSFFGLFRYHRYRTFLLVEIAISTVSAFLDGIGIARQGCFPLTIALLVLYALHALLLTATRPFRVPFDNVFFPLLAWAHLTMAALALEAQRRQEADRSLPSDGLQYGVMVMMLIVQYVLLVRCAFELAFRLGAVCCCRQQSVSERLCKTAYDDMRRRHGYSQDSSSTYNGGTMSETSSSAVFQEMSAKRNSGTASHAKSVPRTISPQHSPTVRGEEDAWFGAEAALHQREYSPPDADEINLRVPTAVDDGQLARSSPLSRTPAGPLSGLSSLIEPPKRRQYDSSASVLKRRPQPRSVDDDDYVVTVPSEVQPSAIASPRNPYSPSGRNTGTGPSGAQPREALSASYYDYDTRAAQPSAAGSRSSRHRPLSPEAIPPVLPLHQDHHSGHMVQQPQPQRRFAQPTPTHLYELDDDDESSTASAQQAAGLVGAMRRSHRTVDTWFAGGQDHTERDALSTGSPRPPTVPPPPPPGRQGRQPRPVPHEDDLL